MPQAKHTSRIHSCCRQLWTFIQEYGSGKIPVIGIDDTRDFGRTGPFFIDGAPPPGPPAPGPAGRCVGLNS